MNQLIVFIALNVIFIALCIPLIRREVPMNSIYGFRLPAAMKSDEAWYRVNALGGRVMVGASCVSILGLITLKIFGADEPLLYVSIFVLPILITLVFILIYTNRQA